MPQLTYLDLLQRASDKAKEARAIIDNALNETRELTSEELTKVNTLGSESDNLREQGEAMEQAERRDARFDSIANVAIRPDVGGSRDAGRKPEWRSFGEFVSAVRFGDPEQRLMTMGDGTAGGILVPDQFSAEFLQVSPEAAVVRPRARVIPAGTPPDAKMPIPALDQGANGVYGGVSVGWIGEGGTKADTTPSLTEIELEPKEVAASVIVTDKLLRNAPAASSIIQQLLTNARIGAEDYAFLRGNGVGKPLGALNSPGRKNITRTTTSDVVYTDILNMLAAMNPEDLSGCVWVANLTTLPKIMGIKDSGNNNIYWGGVARTIEGAMPSSLAGLPLIWSGRTPTLGNAGDLALINFNYYLIKDGSGPFIEASPHVYFVNNKTVIKMFWNVDGQLWNKAPLTLEDGSTTVSPVVVLN